MSQFQKKIAIDPSFPLQWWFIIKAQIKYFWIPETVLKHFSQRGRAFQVKKPYSFTSCLIMTFLFPIIWNKARNGIIIGQEIFIGLKRKMWKEEIFFFFLTKPRNFFQLVFEKKFISVNGSALEVAFEPVQMKRTS